MTVIVKAGSYWCKIYIALGEGTTAAATLWSPAYSTCIIIHPCKCMPAVVITFLKSPGNTSLIVCASRSTFA